MPIVRLDVAYWYSATELLETLSAAISCLQSDIVCNKTHKWLVTGIGLYRVTAEVVINDAIPANNLQLS